MCLIRVLKRSGKYALKNQYVLKTDVCLKTSQNDMYVVIC